MTAMDAGGGDSAVSLRPASPEDADEIGAIWSQGWPEAHEGRVPDELLEHRSPADLRARVPSMLETATVAIVDGRPVGFTVISRDEVEQIYVADRHRGAGIAAQLLAHAEAVIAGRFDRAWLAVVAGNERARRFYERHGWRDLGTFDHMVWTTDGRSIPVPCRRYEKLVRTAGRSGR